MRRLQVTQFGLVIVELDLEMSSLATLRCVDLIIAFLCPFDDDVWGIGVEVIMQDLVADERETKEKDLGTTLTYKTSELDKTVWVEKLAFPHLVFLRLLDSTLRRLGSS